MPFIEQQNGRWVRKTEVGLRQLAAENPDLLWTPLVQNFKTATAFRVLETFRYTTRTAEDDWQDQPAEVDGELLEVEQGRVTDLASIPPCLWGLIASYGGHTMPALLHDAQCAAARDAAAEDSKRGQAMRRRADARFRHTLRYESDAGVVTQWIMWSTVRTFSSTLFCTVVVLAALALWANIASTLVSGLPGTGVVHHAWLPLLAGAFAAAAWVSRETPLTSEPNEPNEPVNRYFAALGDNVKAAAIVALILPTIVPMFASTLLTRLVLMVANILGFVTDQARRNVDRFLPKSESDGTASPALTLHARRT